MIWLLPAPSTRIPTLLTMSNVVVDATTPAGLAADGLASADLEHPVARNLSV